MVAGDLAVKGTALIVVDMQNGYLHPEGSFARLWPEAAKKNVESPLVIRDPIEAGKQFRRVNGHLHLAALRAALEREFAESV